MTEQVDVKLEIFITPTCPYSRALKRKLEHDGTPFLEHNVQSDRAALQRMLLLNGGQRHVPTIVRGEVVSVGFNGH